MSLSQDVRAALRQLARKPLANSAIAATLALGIGSSVALFSLVDAVLLRPLPYPKADELVAYSGTRGRKRAIPARASPASATCAGARRRARSTRWLSSAPHRAR